MAMVNGGPGYGIAWYGSVLVLVWFWCWFRFSQYCTRQAHVLKIVPSATGGFSEKWKRHFSRRALVGEWEWERAREMGLGMGMGMGHGGRLPCCQTSAAAAAHNYLRHFPSNMQHMLGLGLLQGARAPQYEKSFAVKCDCCLGLTSVDSRSVGRSEGVFPLGGKSYRAWH